MAIITSGITVNEKNYMIRDGFPIFSSQFAYINFIKDYPYDPGIDLKIHKIKEGESYWDITMKYNISIDTLIAANPFITNLLAYKGLKIVIPSKNGVLLTFDDFIDVIRMKKKLNYKKEIKSSYLPTTFKLISKDDIRLVFFENVRPVITNRMLEKLYAQKNIFQSPFQGRFSSLFGKRIDPIYNSSKFHNGIDIKGKMNADFYPAREGVVTFTGWKSGYGKTILIQHHDGYETLYGHCNEIQVKKGDWVNKSSVIGLVGSTGRSTGPHLHFAIKRHGEYLNPLPYIW